MKNFINIGTTKLLTEIKLKQVYDENEKHSVCLWVPVSHSFDPYGDNFATVSWESGRLETPESCL